jgi:HEAT repeat protein
MKALRKSFFCKSSVAYALGHLGSQRAVRPLIRALGDPSVECAAIYALGELGSQKAVVPVSERLGAANGNIRRAAALALAKLGDNRGIGVLIDDGLTHYERSVREQAALGLGRLGDKTAIVPLKKALADLDNQVRTQAAKALHSLGEMKWVDIVKGDRKDYDRLVKTRDGVILKTMVRNIGRDDIKIALKNHANEKATDLLLKVVSNYHDPRYANSKSQSMNALEVLRAIGDKRAAQPLAKLLGAVKDDYNDQLRTAIVAVLATLNDKNAVPPLIEALDSESGDFRVAVADALSCLGAPEWKNIIQGDDEDFVRLSEAGRVFGVEHLKKRLRAPRLEHRRSAAMALIGIARQNRGIDIINDDIRKIMRKAHEDEKVHADNGQEKYVSSDCSVHEDEPTGSRWDVGIGMSVSDF